MSGTSGPAHMHPDVDTTSYMVEVPSDDWESWKETVPRTIPLYKRIHHLIKADATDAEAMDEADLSLVMLKFERVAQRCTNCQTALDEGDVDRAERELEKIRDIAAPYID